MNSFTYAFSFTNPIVTHYRQKTSLFKDENEEFQLKAYVHSGDYFEMLATKLDSISVQLEKSDVSIAKELAHISTDLSYLQEHYCITKKES